LNDEITYRVTYHDIRFTCEQGELENLISSPTSDTDAKAEKLEKGLAFV
jgi:hypothetical protein